MYNTREINLDIGRRFVNGEISKKEARELIGGGRNCFIIGRTNTNVQ